MGVQGFIAAFSIHFKAIEARNAHIGTYDRDVALSEASIAVASAAAEGGKSVTADKVARCQQWVGSCIEIFVYILTASSDLKVTRRQLEDASTGISVSLEQIRKAALTGRGAN